MIASSGATEDMWQRSRTRPNSVTTAGEGVVPAMHCCANGDGGHAVGRPWEEPWCPGNGRHWARSVCNAPGPSPQQCCCVLTTGCMIVCATTWDKRVLIFVDSPRPCRDGRYRTSAAAFLQPIHFLSRRSHTPAHVSTDPYLLHCGHWTHACAPVIPVGSKTVAPSQVYTQHMSRRTTSQTAPCMHHCPHGYGDCISGTKMPCVLSLIAFGAIRRFLADACVGGLGHRLPRSDTLASVRQRCHDGWAGGRAWHGGVPMLLLQLSGPCAAAPVPHPRQPCCGRRCGWRCCWMPRDGSRACPSHTTNRAVMPSPSHGLSARGHGIESTRGCGRACARGARGTGAGPQHRAPASPLASWAV
eukprot:m.386339 g.386339  ORF g.386339 m.386339 type:complete len:358 (+) comp21014_c1_seq2:798-1871(+)